MDFLKRLYAGVAEGIADLQPQFFRRLKPSYRWAIVIFVLFVLWIGSGFLTRPATPPSDTGHRTAAIPIVRVAVLDSRERDAVLSIRGRTEALHSVEIKSQVDGIVEAIHFEKGERVRQGQVLCQIRLNDRSAKLAQARALVAQTTKQHAVDLDLAREGFRSTTQVDQSEAALEAARASEQTMDIDLENTRIRAPFDGLVDARFADVGDYMRPGDRCALLIAPEPFLAVGAVSEREVAGLQVGDPATATLVTGETVTGRIRFLSTRADDTTRTFRIEVELPNPDARLRVGVSADIHIPVRHVKAQKISPGILVLDDAGVVGVRAVENGIVRFLPIQIVSDSPDGMWVSGLPDHIAVITVGQAFVTDGERVRAVTAARA
jgi:multidrug efflux system membrane fusion protein